MKPAWDQLGDAYADSSSVVIGDADCTVETKLCSDKGVSGYPTIKYYTAETGADGESYSGGRDFSSLDTFVKDKLQKLCNVADQADCTEKEVKFITKMQEKTADDVQKQLKRLEGMKAQKMKSELRTWLNQRLNILKQLADGESKEEL